MSPRDHPRPLDLSALLERLGREHGPQHWWPGETAFEVMVGAILTQNTAWTNVEKAIARLKAERALAPRTLYETAHASLAEWIRPSGYYRVKAERIQQYCGWYLERGGYASLQREATGELRRELLSIKGIGRETADAILLYAFQRPVFVVDAYTHRLFVRLGITHGDEGYESVRERVETHFGPHTASFNELHALIVAHGKALCRPRPLCAQCGLAGSCPSAAR